MQKHDSPNLDTLRSIAVCTVLVDHLVPTLQYDLHYHSDNLSAMTVQIGHAGVLAFFVHTSLVLMYSMQRLDQADPLTAVTWPFYVRRFFRIYPLSIVCIILVLLLGIPAETWKAPEPFSKAVIIANILLVQNLITKQSVVGPLWSLPYEVQMYLVLPPLYYLSKHKRSLVYITSLFCLCCLIGIAVSFLTQHLNMVAYAPCFLAGVLCYVLGNRQRALFPASTWPWFVGVLVLIYCLVHLGYAEPIFWVGWIFCLVLGCSINLFHPSTSVHLNRITHNIAKYSFGLYLFHVPVLYLIFSVLAIRSAFWGSVLLFPLTMVVSVVMFHLVEAPCIAIGRRISDRNTVAKSG